MDKIKYTIFNIIILILGALALMVGYNWNKVPMPGLNNIPVASSTVSGTNTASSSDASWMNDFTVVTADDQNTTVALNYGERFVIDLGGNLSWTIGFTPDASIIRVPDSTTANGVQGVYEAETIGTSTLQAIGAPICNATGACPQFRRAVSINFVISPNQ